MDTDIDSDDEATEATEDTPLAEAALVPYSPPMLQQAHFPYPMPSSAMTGFAVGLAVVAVLGVGGVILYLALRTKEDQPAVLYAPAPPPQQLRAPDLAVMPTIIGAAVASSTDMPEESSSPRSFNLPGPLQRSRSPIIATANGRARRVTIRAISPPGAFAVIADDVTALFDQTPIPAGYVAVLPVGQESSFNLNPNQILYARGNVPNVMISVQSGPLI